MIRRTIIIVATISAIGSTALAGRSERVTIYASGDYTQFLRYDSGINKRDRKACESASDVGGVLGCLQRRGWRIKKVMPLGPAPNSYVGPHAYIELEKVN